VCGKDDVNPTTKILTISWCASMMCAVLRFVSLGTHSFLFVASGSPPTLPHVRFHNTGTRRRWYAIVHDIRNTRHIRHPIHEWARKRVTASTFCVYGIFKWVTLSTRTPLLDSIFHKKPRVLPFDFIARTINHGVALYSSG
jgi:hypothetical protein